MGRKVGDVLEYDEITTHYCGGRIDIRGVPGDEYWNGWHEYSLPIMHGKSWNLLSDWLDDFTSETLLGYDELIQTFEKDTGHIIEWWED